ncbi:MAG: hypothetical protein JXA82_19305, partial [Sedimentisphaerales bacterium]|nr:hypothetical protein [Sedimentisphaerales bacterium]
MRFKKFLLAKAFFVLVLLCLFLQARAGSIEFDLEIEDNDISLQSNGGYTRVFLKDGISIKDSPGFPELPTRYIRLVIPTGSIPTGVEVEVEEEVFANNLFIYPIQPPHPTDTDMDEALHFDPLAYSILDYYPQESAVLQGTEHLHGFTLAVVRLNVLRYKEDTSQLLYARRIQGKLLFSEVESPPSYLRQTSNPLLQAPIQSQYSDEVARLIVNPQDLVVIPSLKRSGMLDWETENEIQYIIITNEILCDAFQELADYRISKGTSATVITMDWIRSHYEGTRPDGGEDDPTRIRNCIRDYYLNYGTRWAVLGGDDVPVPVRYCSKPWVDIPCDLYYGCLDGTWDADGDGIYGEIEDEVDFASEVWIGRIPVQTSEQALAYIAKVRTYENRSPDGFANTMLLQAHCGANDKLKTGLDRPLDFQDHDPVDPWEMSTRQLYQMDNWGIQNFWQASRLSYFFETYTSWDRVYCGDYDYGYMSCNVLEKLNWGYHYIFSSSHGNTNYYTSVNTLIADQMTNADRPSIFLISSCSTAHFDQCEVCLSEALLRNPKGGAVIYIGYTRPGWLRPDDARCLFSELYENNRQTIGEAFSVSRAYYATVNTIDDGYRDLLFMVNLHGDPGLRVLRGENGRHVQMMSPKGCEVIDENADIWIRWNACGADYMSDETVRLDYSADAGNTWQAVPGAENLPYNSRWFLWEEPMLAPGSDYRIRVMANTDPSISDTSESNFTIGTMYTLRVMSTPKQNIWVTGSHYNFTDYTYRVLEGRPVSFRAGALTGYNFVRWADANKNTITRNMAIHFIMTGNKTITAEYESAGSLRDYYVNDEIAEDGFSPGSNENDGFSPSSPVRNIQEILDRYSDIKTLYVSAGTYKENLVIGSGDPNIVLQGYGRDSTILDGQEREPCLNIQNTSHIAIQGFTIQNGYHSNGNGGGIALDNAKSIRILRNRICNNVSGYHGGGVCIDHVSGIAEVAENEIYGNSGTAVGGGVSFLNCSDVGLRDNSIYGNTSKICGGIWFFVIGKIEVANNVIRDNQSNENGGGLFLQSASGIIQINEIINNSALGSGG